MSGPTNNRSTASERHHIAPSLRRSTRVRIAGSAPGTPYSISVEETKCVVCGSNAAEAEASGKDYMYACCDDVFEHMRCLACGHLYMNPRPAPDAAPIIYPANHISYASTIAKSKIVSRAKNLAILRRLRHALTKTQRIKILEIGCGDGQLLLAIRKGFPEAELAGLDFHIHPQAVRNLRSAGISVIEQPAEDAELKEAHYDLVVMNQVIEHLWDVDRVLRLSARALKPTGLLSVETPDSESYDRAIFRRGLWGSYYYPRHLNLFSMRGLKTVLARNGFQVIESYNTVAPLCWILTMNSIAGHYPGWSWLRRLFTVTSFAPIALFTLMDLAALTAGWHTPNQRVVAKRRDAL